MNKKTAIRAAFAGAGIAAAGVAGMATAAADEGVQRTDLGGSAQVANQQWAVTGLRPSSDSIDYALAGKLWEASATNTAVAGGSIPLIPPFSARGGADTYPVLWEVATAQGVNPAGLDPGQSVTGKLYFDVTGANPVEVVFTDGGHDTAVWVTPPPPPVSSAGTGGGGYGSALPAAAEAASEALGGSQGTPLPADAVAEGSAAATAAEAVSEGTPLPTAVPSTVPAAAAPGAVSHGTPAPATTAPATLAPLPAGSSSTGVSQGDALTAPTTAATVVPLP